MVLFSSSSFGGEETNKGNKMKLKDLWTNDKGEIAEGNNGLPKGWAKKLIAKAGDEISDLQAKEYGLKDTKAKKLLKTSQSRF